MRFSPLWADSWENSRVTFGFGDDQRATRQSSDPSRARSLRKLTRFRAQRATLRAARRLRRSFRLAARKQGRRKVRDRADAPVRCSHELTPAPTASLGRHPQIAGSGKSLHDLGAEKRIHRSWSAALQLPGHPYVSRVTTILPPIAPQRAYGGMRSKRTSRMKRPVQRVFQTQGLIWRFTRERCKGLRASRVGDADGDATACELAGQGRADVAGTDDGVLHSADLLFVGLEMKSDSTSGGERRDFLDCEVDSCLHGLRA